MSLTDYYESSHPAVSIISFESINIACKRYERILFRYHNLWQQQLTCVIFHTVSVFVRFRHFRYFLYNLRISFCKHEVTFQLSAIIFASLTALAESITFAKNRDNIDDDETTPCCIPSSTEKNIKSTAGSAVFTLTTKRAGAS